MKIQILVVDCKFYRIPEILRFSAMSPSVSHDQFSSKPFKVLVFHHAKNDDHSYALPRDFLRNFLLSFQIVFISAGILSLSLRRHFVFKFLLLNL